MVETVYRFRYHPRDGETVLDGYDASQALYGIARSLSMWLARGLSGFSSS
jgi:hypothetical protein